jgi:hypothetical protein
MVPLGDDLLRAITPVEVVEEAVAPGPVEQALQRLRSLGRGIPRHKAWEGRVVPREVAMVGMGLFPVVRELWRVEQLLLLAVVGAVQDARARPRQHGARMVGPVGPVG